MFPHSLLSLMEEKLNITYQDKHITIVDNFLDEETLKLVRDQTETLKMQKVELGDDKVYKFNSGLIYKSEHKYWSNKMPWNNNFQPFMEKLIEFISDGSTCLPQAQFDKISCMLHVYMSGAELSWHRDGALGGGAYSFYVHNEWKHTWGGNLMVADSDTKVQYHGPLEGTSLEDMIGRDYGFRARTWDLSTESKDTLTPGHGRYFAPVPNRLMITTGETTHKVERVDLSAGENSRRSLTGFFA